MSSLDVRFTSNRVQTSARQRIDVVCQSRTSARLFDHLVGALLKKPRHVEAERFGGLHDQLESATRAVSRHAAELPPRKPKRLPKATRAVDPIRRNREGPCRPARRRHAIHNAHGLSTIAMENRFPFLSRRGLAR